PLPPRVEIRQQVRETVVPHAPQVRESASEITRTAMCAESRNGVFYIFMPPTGRLEDYLELVTAIEATAATLSQPIVMEGYEPPRDPRLNTFRVTHDPRVIGRI